MELQVFLSKEVANKTEADQILDILKTKLAKTGVTVKAMILPDKYPDAKMD